MHDSPKCLICSSIRYFILESNRFSPMLQLVSITLVSGLFILLRSATKITHKAQSITGLAAKWHICATINSFDNIDGETPTAAQVASPQAIAAAWGSSDDEVGDEEDDLDNTKMLPIYTRTISFNKRQALGKWEIFYGIFLIKSFVQLCLVLNYYLLMQ